MISLELDAKHLAALEELATTRGMSKSAVLRQALRLYQMVDIRLKNGEQLAFVRDGKIIPQLIIGIGEVP